MLNNMKTVYHKTNAFCDKHSAVILVTLIVLAIIIIILTEQEIIPKDFRFLKGGN